MTENHRSQPELQMVSHSDWDGYNGYVIEDVDPGPQIAAANQLCVLHQLTTADQDKGRPKVSSVSKLITLVTVREQGVPKLIMTIPSVYQVQCGFQLQYVDQL